MTQDIDTLCEHTKIRLIAAALGHQQCTKTEAYLIPLPGTDRYIAAGTADQVRALLPGQALPGIDLDLDKLEALALAYTYENGDHWYCLLQIADGITYGPAANFITGFSPATALALIAQARAAQARPGDDELWDQTLRERDTYQEWADKLAEAIGKHLGIEIGEHSNTNCPWAVALEWIEGAAQAAVPVVAALDEFQPGQWWLDELENISISRDLTMDQVRAVAVARKFIAAVFADRAAASQAAPADKMQCAIDALDGMGFTYHDDAGWLPPAPAQQAGAAAPEVVQLRADKALLLQLRDAVGKLVKAKGRYHTEQNYGALVAAYDLTKPVSSLTPTATAATTGEDARDAARYRWLRDNMRFVEDGQKTAMDLRSFIYTEHHNIHTDWQEHLWDASVDATVDAAMRATQQEGGK